MEHTAGDGCIGEATQVMQSASLPNVQLPARDQGGGIWTWCSVVDLQLVPYTPIDQHKGSEHPSFLLDLWSTPQQMGV